MERDDHDEIMRLRDRMHSVESKLVGIELVLAALREWQHKVDGRLKELAEKLDGIVKADEIADEVAKRMRQTRSLHLTRVQRVLGVIGTLALVATAARSWF